MKPSATMNQPKPDTPKKGVKQTAHARVVHGKNNHPKMAIQPEVNAIVIRSEKSHSRMMANLGDRSAMSATKQGMGQH